MGFYWMSEGASDLSQGVSKSLIVGVDGGGTETRVLCADTSGALLSHACGAGANWNHNREATENVREVIARALRLAGATLLRVSGAFHEPPISVALIGSVARSSFIARAFEHRLALAYRLHTLATPELSPAAGAVLIGLRELGAGALAEARLAEQPRARFGAALTEASRAAEPLSAE